MRKRRMSARGMARARSGSLAVALGALVLLGAQPLAADPPMPPRPQADSFAPPDPPTSSCTGDATSRPTLSAGRRVPITCAGVRRRSSEPTRPVPALRAILAGAGALSGGALASARPRGELGRDRRWGQRGPGVALSARGHERPPRGRPHGQLVIDFLLPMIERAAPRS